jgi:hypothetical protein
MATNRRNVPGDEEEQRKLTRARVKAHLYLWKYGPETEEEQKRLLANILGLARESLRTIAEPAVSQPLPDYSEYMRLIDGAIEEEGLGPDDRVVARAFAIAVYRRALAHHLMSDVKILASEAITAVMERLGKQEGRNVKEFTYEYGSKSTTGKRVSRRSRTE